MEQPISDVGGETRTIFGMDVVALTHIDFIVDFPISLALWNCGPKVSILILQIGENWGFFAPRIFRGHIINFGTYRVVWQSFAKDGLTLGTSKILWVKNEITRLKYNSLPLSLKRYAGDCNRLLPFQDFVMNLQVSK